MSFTFLTMRSLALSVPLHTRKLILGWPCRKRKIASQQDGSGYCSNNEALQVAQGICYPNGNVCQDSLGMQDKIPTVPAQEPAKVYPQAGQPDGHKHKHPSHKRTCIVAYQLLHGPQREYCQKQPGQSKG